MAKRFLDVVLSFTGLLVLLPALAVVAALIRAEGAGPLIFRQSRVGRHGRPFTMLKFRTMRPAARPTEDEPGCATFHPGDASRVTRVGRLLRRTKLDELPQLWNVLVGDMSLVGPRPEVRRWVDVYPDRWARVHMVRPGITDPASLVFCDEESLLSSSADPERLYRDVVLPRKLELYEQYVTERTFWGDAWLIVKTPFVVISHVLRRRVPWRRPAPRKRVDGAPGC